MLELNKIYNMDCLDGMKLIDNESVDLIVTSPPYYNAKSYSHWDSYESYLEWLRIVSVNMFNVLKAGRMVCVNLSVVIQPRESRNSESKRFPIPFHYVNIMEKLGFKFLEDIIWIKPSGAVPNRNGGFYRCRQPMQYKPNVVNEYILVFQKPSNFLIDKILKTYDTKIKQESLVSEDYFQTNVWNINPEKSKNHPAPFPKDIPLNLIKYYSFIGDTVLDPFIGSGTTAVACKKLNRHYIGFDLNEKYCELAKDRVDNYTEQIKFDV